LQTNPNTIDNPLADPQLEAGISIPTGFRRGRTVGIVGLLTVIVAVFGYLRESALAARFGVSAGMDAYFAAIFIPNTLYFLLIAGTFSPVFIPILLQENTAEDRDAVSNTFSNVTNFVLLVLLVTIAFGMLTARVWLPLLFSGFDSATTELSVRLTYIIFPAVMFLAISGILTAVLNGFHRFALPALVPAWTSLSVIAGAFIAGGENAIYVIAIATAAGFCLQGLMLIPATASLGIHYRPVMDLRHPAIGKLLRLGVPLFLYLLIASASALVERNLASHLSAGAVSVLTYAFRLFTVPGNFLAAPLATVAYPLFAREAGRPDRGNLKAEFSKTLRMMFLLFLPTSLWVILNALPVTRLLYEHGSFHLQDSLLTSRVLAVYATAILPYALAVVTLRCLFALQDTMTPLWTEIAQLAYFVIAANFLTHHYGIIGVVTARSLGFFLVGATLLLVLGKKLQLALGLDTAWFVLRTAIASAAMALASWTSFHFLHPAFDSGNTLLRLLIVGSVLAISGATFFAAALLLRINEARQVVRTAADFLPATLRDRWRSGPSE
jgi:putative peptidoglycan lipid II flippase